jgi:hypothetical protein
MTPRRQDEGQFGDKVDQRNVPREGGVMMMNDGHEEV